MSRHAQLLSQTYAGHHQLSTGCAVQRVRVANFAILSVEQVRHRSASNLRRHPVDLDRAGGCARANGQLLPPPNDHSEQLDRLRLETTHIRLGGTLVGSPRMCVGLDDRRVVFERTGRPCSGTAPTGWATTVTRELFEQFSQRCRRPGR
jgi:hypothetical protein